MAVDLTRQLRWKSVDGDTRHLLATLQGNVLKSHGRARATHLFFRLGNGRAASGRALRRVADLVTTAGDQLASAEAYRLEHRLADPFVSICLTYRGYVRLGRRAEAPQDEPMFVNGMQDRSSVQAVGDSLADWEDAYRQPFDGMIIIADGDPGQIGRWREMVAAFLEEARGAVVHEQPGAVLRNRDGNSVEPFGYRDSLSQPIFLEEDLETGRQPAVSQWNPAAPLADVLTTERGRQGDCGSYLVFRKLEQDVAGFDAAVSRVASTMGWPGDRGRDLAGALVVGRFKDGTPVTRSDHPIGGEPLNDFDYRDDLASRCPYHAHVRKLNPRGSGKESLADERLHLMPRRGISYEEPTGAVRSPAQYDVDRTYWNRSEKVSTGTKTGLLFMAYNASLARQFVVAQAQWANDRRYPDRSAGIDPLIGQGPPRAPLQSWRKRWNDPSSPTRRFDFGSFVTMRGGEYFYAPSLTFLKSL